MTKSYRALVVLLLLAGAGSAFAEAPPERNFTPCVPFQDRCPSASGDKIYSFQRGEKDSWWDKKSMLFVTEDSRGNVLSRRRVPFLDVIASCYAKYYGFGETTDGKIWIAYAYNCHPGRNPTPKTVRAETFSPDATNAPIPAPAVHINEDIPLSRTTLPYGASDVQVWVSYLRAQNQFAFFFTAHDSFSIQPGLYAADGSVHELGDYYDSGYSVFDVFKGAVSESGNLIATLTSKRGISVFDLKTGARLFRRSSENLAYTQASIGFVEGSGERYLSYRRWCESGWDEHAGCKKISLVIDLKTGEERQVD